MARRKDGKPRILGGVYVPMTKSGFCEFPSFDGTSHIYCKRVGCTCTCHNSDAGANPG